MKNQKPSSSEETVQAKVRGGSPGGRSETKGVGFVKEVGLSREWKRDGVLDVQSGESEEAYVSVTIWNLCIIIPSNSSVDWLGETVTDVGGAGHHAP